MRHRHERQHDDEPDDDLVVDLTDRLAPYGASEASPAGAEAAPEALVPTHAAILAAVDHDRAGAGRS